MSGSEALAVRFEAHREHLRGVAFRLLGSLDEADDAVQLAWLRADRADLGDVTNLAGWLTTVVARISLDLLRARRSRGEEPASAVEPRGGVEPEAEAVLAESVGLAVLVVLDRLTPAERVAFVLHDVFALPFDEIAVVVGRSTAASKKLASRARGRVRGAPATGDRTALARNHAVVEAFLSAARDGDLDALIEVLAPDVVRRADRFAAPPGAAAEIRGARAVAEATALNAYRISVAEVVLVDGEPGVVVAPRGRLLLVLSMTVREGRIVAYDVVGDPVRLARISLALDPGRGN
ncbi:sigma-70 family RNA polymerase sigma factor [Lentzea sp. NPDC058450]|uniref:sigma-70 family RNA polymerase sigma factor n=1 Tax=Lentzea sp. NPDC058450 TaxID=3346505 RepID=UPI003660CD06